MKLYPFVLALLAIGASTPILAGQADEPSTVPWLYPGGSLRFHFIDVWEYWRG